MLRKLPRRGAGATRIGTVTDEHPGEDPEPHGAGPAGRAIHDRRIQLVSPVPRVDRTLARIEQRIVFHQHNRRLNGIHRAAAAETDHHVAVRFVRQFDRPLAGSRVTIEREKPVGSEAIQNGLDRSGRAPGACGAQPMMIC